MLKHKQIKRIDLINIMRIDYLSGNAWTYINGRMYNEIFNTLNYNILEMVRASLGKVKNDQT